MAGTIVASTLSDGTNSTSTTNCISGSAKAWVNYKGTTTRSIRASYNVSSVTVVTTGTYTINFTNAFADANYSTTGFATYGASVAAAGLFTSGNDFAPTTTACTLKSGNSTDGSVQDPTYFCAAFFR